MNYLMVFKSLGTLCYIEAAGMLISFGIALPGGDGDAPAFLLSALITAAVGLGMSALRPKSTDIYAKDGFAVVGFGWLLVSVLGALPFLLSGVTPFVVDALFESISGFSTTGASVLRAVGSLPRGILFWRSLTLWMGGLGFLVLMLAILPGARANTVHIMRAEFPGPSPDKFVPKIGQVAKILYGIYLAVTAAVFLLLLLGGMGPFDAAVHALGTASTGGFSSRGASVGAFDSAYVEGVITVFMLLSGVNFTLYYALLKRNWRPVLRDEELRLYTATALAAAALVALNLLSSGVYRAPGEALRHASFQVASLLSTTGYTTADFNVWPALSQFVLFLLTVLGATAGSTGGGLKCVRVLLLCKIARREVGKLIHPRSIRAVTINGKAVEESTLSGVVIFFFLYVLLAAAGVLVLSTDGKDLFSTISAVFASLNNIGPGLGLVETTGHYADFSAVGKLTLSLCMIVGRLEIYPVLLLCAPTFWRRVNL
ncbi:MAG: TrkH family potassium uptake protein [Oscillospiraceae bacterium]|jgi:trk system potassium uptake protein TrkH|nr:TrkH family potassium uptake protein [Oscillospiraceae bacterium]